VPASDDCSIEQLEEMTQGMARAEAYRLIAALDEQ
jgi:hypothetical protein